MRVVVTGAGGFLGASVVRALRVSRVPVIAVARREGKGIHKVENYAQTPSGDVLVHLAEESVRAKVNATGVAYEQASSATLRALLKKGFTRVVYASSAALYGDQSELQHRVTDDLDILDTYSRVKRAGELAVLSHGVGVAVRIANLYGPRMSPNSVLGSIIDQVVQEKCVIRIRDDTPIRDFLWVDDAASCIASMACGSPIGLYNLGSGEAVSIASLANVVFDSVPRRDLRLEVTHRSQVRSALRLECDETRRVWCWAPKVNLRDGVQIILKHRQSFK